MQSRTLVLVVLTAVGAVTCTKQAPQSSRTETASRENAMPDSRGRDSRFDFRKETVQRAVRTLQPKLGEKPFTLELLVDGEGRLDACAITSVGGEPRTLENVPHEAEAAFCKQIGNETFEARGQAYSLNIAVTAPHLR